MYLVYTWVWDDGIPIIGFGGEGVWGMHWGVLVLMCENTWCVMHVWMCTQNNTHPHTP